MSNGRRPYAHYSLSICFTLLSIRKLLPLFFSLFSALSPLFAQVAGRSVLEVLDMSVSPRAAALGMDHLAVFDQDLTLTFDNPSLLGAQMHNQVALSFASSFAKTNFGALAYGYDTKRLGTLVFAFRFNNYGTFQGYDENDVSTGSFSAADYLLSVGWGFNINPNFSIGATLKPVYSHYESYRSFAVAIDVSGSFVSDNKRFAASLLARNIGAQIVTFDNSAERLPFELSATLSYKLSKAPFRIYFTANDLQCWNLRYADGLNPTSSTDPFSGEVKSESKAAAFFDNLGRHAQIGLELDIKKVFFARVGFNYRQLKETQVSGGFNGSAFSFGVGLRIKGFEISYSRNNYHYGQAPNFFSLSIDIDRFCKK